MNNLAIPATPPPTAATSPAAAAAPAAANEHFGDTLRKTQNEPETQEHGRAADAAAPSEPVDRKADSDNNDGEKEDERADRQVAAKIDDRPADPANALPIVAPVVPIAAAGLRPMTAAGGKPLPGAAGPIAVMKGGVPPMELPATTTAPSAQSPAIVANNPPPVATMSAADADAADAMPTPLSLHDSGKPADADGDKPTAPQRFTANDFTAHLSQLVGAHTAPATTPANAAAPLQLAMQATPDQPQQFAQETTQHVAWLAGKGIDKAEIQLNPRKLGPIHVEISTHNDRVDVSFAVQHPQTVHALQQTLPQLHDMLAQQGLNLGQASVGQQSPGQQHAAFAQHLDGNTRGDANSSDAEPAPDWRPLRVATPGRVDDFA